MGTYTDLGLRWLGCGWRFFKRHPRLLGGMGIVSATIVVALSLIPLLGGSLIAFVAPILLASFYLVIDRLSASNLSAPVLPLSAALRQSARELFCVFREENRILPMVTVSLYGMIVSLLTHAFVWLIAGSAWAKPWTSLGLVPLLSVGAALLLALTLYFVLALSIVYALPRTFLRGKPLFPEIGRSLRAGKRYLFALSTVLGVLLLPIVVGAAMSLISLGVAYAAMLVLNTLVLPLVACSLYCSYRTIFQSPPVRR